MNSQLKIHTYYLLCTYTFVKPYMFLTYPLRRGHYLQQSGAQYVISVTHPTVKILADETRLGIVLLLSELGDYASAISALPSISRSPRYPATVIAA